MSKGNFAVDLHIHSALSPCAHEDMSPNNIVNMAVIKGLDIIAVTDHNSAGNLPAIEKCCINNNILMLPGIEVNSREEVHLLVYFNTLSMAMEFSKVVYKHLPDILNDKRIFGNQIIFDEEDLIIGEEAKLLISATDLSIEEITKIVRNMEGTVIPAHIDKKSNSIYNNLGFIPENLHFKTLEITNQNNLSALVNISHDNFKYITSSDAHYLGDIMEREQFLNLDSLKTYNIIKNL